jgi:hypothetical protein
LIPFVLQGRQAGPREGMTVSPLKAVAQIAPGSTSAAGRVAPIAARGDFSRICPKAEAAPGPRTGGEVPTLARPEADFRELLRIAGTHLRGIGTSCARNAPPRSLVTPDSITRRADQSLRDVDTLQAAREHKQVSQQRRRQCRQSARAGHNHAARAHEAVRVDSRFRFNVLVDSEQVVGIVLCLDRGKALVVVAIA